MWHYSVFKSLGTGLFHPTMFAITSSPSPPHYLLPITSNSLPQTARLEFIGILSELVRMFPTHSRFSDMASSLSTLDPEVDFFENIRHIQLHRRTRSLRRLAEACSAGSISISSITTFLLPLAAQVIFGIQSNAEQNLVAEAINVVAATARRMKWTGYSFLLRHYMRQLPKKQLNHKVFIK